MTIYRKKIVDLFPSRPGQSSHFRNMHRLVSSPSAELNGSLLSDANSLFFPSRFRGRAQITSKSALKIAPEMTGYSRHSKVAKSEPSYDCECELIFLSEVDKSLSESCGSKDGSRGFRSSGWLSVQINAVKNFNIKGDTKQ